MGKLSPQSVVRRNDGAHMLFASTRFHSLERRTLPTTNVSLIDREKMDGLLAQLRSDEFVGNIDPEYHSSYLSAPDLEDLRPALVRNTAAAQSLRNTAIARRTSSTDTFQSGPCQSLRDLRQAINAKREQTLKKSASQPFPL